jgi:hypothetical protein
MEFSDDLYMARQGAMRISRSEAAPLVVAKASQANEVGSLSAWATRTMKLRGT